MIMNLAGFGDATGGHDTVSIRS